MTSILAFTLPRTSVRSVVYQATGGESVSKRTKSSFQENQTSPRKHLQLVTVARHRRSPEFSSMNKREKTKRGNTKMKRKPTFNENFGNSRKVAREKEKAREKGNSVVENRSHSRAKERAKRIGKVVENLSIPKKL